MMMAVKPNNSFKPNLLRSTKAMAEKACHGLGSTTQVGLTQALDAMPKLLLAVTLTTSQFIGTVLACTCPPPGSKQRRLERVVRLHGYVR